MLAKKSPGGKRASLRTGGSARLWAALLTFLVACGDSRLDTATSDPNAPAGNLAPAGSDNAASDAGAAAPNTDTGKCASKFGTALTAGFGRIDGTLLAVVRPQDQTCVLPNRDHVVVQVKMNGGVYRLVVNVQSDRGTDLRVRMQTLAAPLPGPVWEEGWHSGVALDYVALGAHTASGFEPLEIDALVPRILGELRIGDPISVYASNTDGRSDGAHLVHRNDGKVDGAIVVAPTSSAARFLLFHFATQTF